MDTNKRDLPADYEEPSFQDSMRAFTDAILNMNPSAVFLLSVWDELQRARLMFPNPDGVMAALAEETGELAKALLGQPRDHVAKEARQVAAVACRVATEGDPILDPTRHANGLEPSVPAHTPIRKQ